MSVRWNVIYAVDGRTQEMVVDTNEDSRYDAITQALAHIVRTVRIGSVIKADQQPQP